MVHGSFLVNRVLSFVEVHNAGMPVRIVYVPGIPGKDMKEKKAFCESKLDWIRRLLTYEPRGSSNSYGALLTNPTTTGAHFGAVFFSSGGWHDMCGHASMGVACYLVRCGLIEPMTAGGREVEVVVDTVAGIVKLYVETTEPSKGQVRMVNVPSFTAEKLKFSSRRFGDIVTHVAYGGNLYAIVDLDEMSLNWSMEILPDLVELAKELWKPVEKFTSQKYPYELHGFRFSKKISSKPPRYYGILIFGTQARPLLDRSPSGTGSSAQLAYLYDMGAVEKHEPVEFVSAVNTVFVGKVLEECTVNSYKGIIPEISTPHRACYITGYSTVVLEPGDPLSEGVSPLPI